MPIVCLGEFDLYERVALPPGYRFAGEACEVEPTAEHPSGKPWVCTIEATPAAEGFGVTIQGEDGKPYLRGSGRYAAEAVAAAVVKAWQQYGSLPGNRKG